MSQEKKADDLFLKAEKKFKSFGLFSGSQKYDDACDMYVKAANLYKISKKWEKAAKSFIHAHHCQLKLESKHEAATFLIKAGQCFRKLSSEKAVETFIMAIDIFVDGGRFNMAAKYYKEIAEIYEKEKNYEKSILFYEKASDFFESENSKSTSNQCLLKVALYSAQLGQYDRAIDIYENVATESLENNLLKWSAKDYFLRAGILHLCAGDVVSARKGFERYQELDITFTGQRECTFLDDIITAFEEGDVEKFTNVVYDYDSISKLDAWKISMLLKVKSQIKQGVEDVML
ncbi:alpha-soluble nsf attachment protein [Anaeramoeba flamelloides]|uniref:Alpha-soluble nsf attachment protein n=1 Tax=Anaeramoeba flamelloides TaxID=1746091 RepID=A0AAV7Z5I0_9EUKA|nr:alpha-soluble nsf attachment protein [Anaeramoeba flamelloides]KAJ6248918.1 alpha-soluble nsf attachment protein [Anaeramoeba flamelloides]